MYSDREIEAINIQCFYRKICPMPVTLLFFDVSCLLVLYSLFYFFKIIFNTIYSFSIFYPPIPPRSYPSNFVVFLFLKKKWWKTKNKNQRKQTKKNKKINKTKKSQNNSVQISCCPFSLAKYSWAWELPQNVFYILRNTTLKKTDFPFPGSHQLQITSYLRVRLFVHIPF